MSSVPHIRDNYNASAPHHHPRIFKAFPSYSPLDYHKKDATWAIKAKRRMDKKIVGYLGGSGG